MKKNDSPEYDRCCYCASPLSEIEKIECVDHCVICKPSANPITLYEWIRYSYLQYKIHRMKERFNSNGDKYLFKGILSEIGSGRITDFTTADELKKIYKRMREMKR